MEKQEIKQITDLIAAAEAKLGVTVEQHYRELMEESMALIPSEKITEDTTRGVVYIKEAANNSVRALHYAPQNLFRFNLNYLTKLGKEASPLATTTAAAGLISPLLQAFLAFLTMAAIIKDMAERELPVSVAEVTCAIARLDKTWFTREEVVASYREQFKKDLSEQHFLKAIRILSDLSICSVRTPSGKYELRDKLIPRVDHGE